MWCGVGSCNYQVNHRGKTRKFVANPGTIFVLPQGTVDELIWNGPVLRIAVSIQPDLCSTHSRKPRQHATSS